jgi:hypothetical protein
VVGGGAVDSASRAWRRQRAGTRGGGVILYFFILDQSRYISPTRELT